MRSKVCLPCSPEKDAKVCMNRPKSVQVSVRKAALGVIAALLKAMPGQVAPAQLWVTSALPMIRDVEASLQEQLLDHVHTFLMVPAGPPHRRLKTHLSQAISC